MPPKLSRAEYLKQLPTDVRFRVLRHELLSRVARSSVNRNYVLRGSTVLKHWFGAAAREPQDLDLVALYPHDPERCIAEVLHIGNDPNLRGPTFPVTRANMLPMWEYDLFPGIRFHMPSSAEWVRQIPSVQLDVAFDNDPELPAEEIELQGPEGLFPVRLRAWTREACLASKLCWIANDLADSTPDEDDLFDALLLAKSGTIDADLLQICVQDILRVQKKSVAIFDDWHTAVMREMRRGGKTERRYPPPLTGWSMGEARTLMQKRQESVRKVIDAYLYSLVYELAPLLAGTVWFLPQQEWGFVSAIVKTPADRLARGAYADWLTDREDERGDWLRLLARIRAGEPTAVDETARFQELSERIPGPWQTFVWAT